jgi:hypothetical protein
MIGEGEAYMNTPEERALAERLVDRAIRLLPSDRPS